MVASLGELGGVVPYTSYSARTSYLKEHSDTIEAFTRAIQKGLDYVHQHSDSEIAKAIVNQFPDTSLSTIEKAVHSYQDIDAWPTTTEFSEKSFNHLQDIMIDYGIIEKKVPYSKLIYDKK